MVRLVKCLPWVIFVLVVTGCFHSSTQNRLPNADAGDDQDTILDAKVTLDGSGSFDIDGVIQRYEWVFERVPEGSQAVLSDANSVAPSFVADIAGTYVVSLRVFDGEDYSVTRLVNICVLCQTRLLKGGILYGGDDSEAYYYHESLVSRHQASEVIILDKLDAITSFVSDIEDIYIVYRVTDEVVNLGMVFQYDAETSEILIKKIILDDDVMDIELMEMILPKLYCDHCHDVE